MSGWIQAAKQQNTISAPVLGFLKSRFVCMYQKYSDKKATSGQFRPNPVIEVNFFFSVLFNLWLNLTKIFYMTLEGG